MTRRRSTDDLSPGDPEAATVREAKGSVQEAIGKLLGDDKAEAQGTAEKQAAAKSGQQDLRSRR